MKREEDISILLTDKNFRRLLSGWEDYDQEEKDELCRAYGLTYEGILSLLQMRAVLDFRRFRMPAGHVETALSEVMERVTAPGGRERKERPPRRLFEALLRIAAVLIVPVLVYAGVLQFYVLRQEKGNAAGVLTVRSQEGTITSLVLPDGSKVWLNSGSTISYPHTFSGSTRTVSLTGEAYFEVVKNPGQPMVVTAGLVDLKVYGTHFNVNAFSADREKLLSVTLVEGSVSLLPARGTIGGRKEFFMEPGQTVTFNGKTKQLYVKRDDPFYYTAWKDGLLVYRNTSFEVILESLSRKFGVDIVLKDSSLGDIPIDATFRNENLNEILRLLSLSTPFDYYYGTSRKRADGSFEKSKIFIERK